ncbi:hypothetical protein CLV84_1408 [Neolewinella xylanilytica]|uniref:Uncharacterized protein n=1 Tax=Neolewinella xylanilytica TaxID=1514080 RepID=A0A2S6IAB4_9BACT|nr:hypothetical protein [Neolewinella xylanilytica]PPK88441.1 hypothetical protein CLV84_1408 [Neolewinella xylanilytica]
MPTNTVLDSASHPGWVYLEKSLWISTFIGGPLAAGYVLATNFRTLDRAERIPQVWVSAVALALFLYYLVDFVPPLADLPGFVPPLLTALLAHYVFQRTQLSEINVLIDRGGGVYSKWRGVLVGIGGGVVSFAGFVVLELIREGY